MIRTKELVVSPELKNAWKKAIAPVAKAFLADFRSWPLYEHVGEPWPDAPKKRFVRVTSFSAVSKALNTKTTEKLLKAANPGLNAMYMNLSTLLNVRNQYFDDEWSGGVTDIVLEETENALADLSKRLKWKPSDKEKWILGIRTQHVHPAGMPGNSCTPKRWKRLFSSNL